MEPTRNTDPIRQRIEAMSSRLRQLHQFNRYFYNQPISELRGGARIMVNGREMVLHASYSYLGLIGHPRINAAAKKALEQYGTGTHGVRTLAGSLPVHNELEDTIADFFHREAAVTFSSGYVTNMSVIATIVGHHDYVFSDKYNHASIVDGCELSGAQHVRYRHNDMESLERRLQETPADSGKLVVTDGVFSMDGDIVNLPRLVELCRKYSAWLMVDEAHSFGMLGKTGRGVEEHFNMVGAIDFKMGTLSKVIPSIGGYIAGKKEIVEFLRHSCRAYLMSAALPPAQAAAALEAFRVIADEPWRVEKLRQNATRFIQGLRSRGFDTLQTETAIVPIMCGADETAFDMTRKAMEKNVFALPVVSPAVPLGLARLRATVTANHEPEDIDYSMQVLHDAGKELGICKS